MKNIAVVTSNRAEYGILIPLIKRINEDDELQLSLIVTGAHLSLQYGNTIEEIKNDGFPVCATVPILEEGNEAIDISKTTANAIKGFSELFNGNKPDMVVLLGDRTEILGVAIAAMNENIPIAHIHGGEVTKGAVDDGVRHALTKLSYLHFAGTEGYRRRIIQMGENPSRVFNVGTLSAENILKAQLMSETEIRNELGIPSGMKYAVVTLHPETIDSLSPEYIAGILCECMELHKDCFYIITSSNSDAGGDTINSIFTELADNNDHVVFKYSLGMRRYLSAVRYAQYVLGNSSSGIVEAPVLGTPTINIGNRQCGRIMADTIINVPFDEKLIVEAMDEVQQIERKRFTLYGDGNTSERMVTIIKEALKEGIDLKKGFYDITE